MRLACLNQGGALAGDRVGEQEETPAAGMSKRDKHIRPRGRPTRQESGWRQGAISTPLERTHRKALTSQWSCEAGKVGAGPRLGHRPQVLGSEKPWAGSPRVGQVGRPGPGSHSRVPWPDLGQGQWWGCRGLGRRALHGKGAAAALGTLGSQRQRLGNPERSTVGKPGPQFPCQDKGCGSLGGAWDPAD